MVYSLRVDSRTADYLRVALAAPSGPLSTSDYALVFEATPLDGQRTFLHFGYAYTISSLAKMAMNLYLATAGRTKIGFTVLAQDAHGRPQHVLTERHAAQLHELDLEQYLQEKHADLARMAESAH